MANSSHSKALRKRNPMRQVITARHWANRASRAARHRHARMEAGTWHYMGRGLRKKAHLASLALDSQFTHRDAILRIAGPFGYPHPQDHL